MHLEFDLKPNGLPVVRKEQLEDLGTRILAEYMPEALEKPMAIDIREFIEENFYLNVQEADLWPADLLGFITFADVKVPVSGNETLPVETGTIILNKDLKKKPGRWRFTLAHELAHWILHRNYHTRENRIFEFRQAGYSYIACRTDKTEFGRKHPKEATTDDEWSEWQADNLAAALLLPKEPFMAAAKESMLSHGFPEQKLISGYRKEEGKVVVKELADLYRVTYRCIRIRMRYCGLYEGATRQYIAE